MVQRKEQVYVAVGDGQFYRAGHQSGSAGPLSQAATPVDGGVLTWELPIRAWVPSN